MVSIDINVIMFSSLFTRRELFHRVFDVSSSYSFTIDCDNKSNYIMNPTERLSWKQHFKVMVSYKLLKIVIGYYQELIICRGEYLTPYSPVLYDCAEVKQLPFRVT